MKVEVLAARAANDYRGRDTVTYLAIRHYLLARSARYDRWAREIATSLTVHRTGLPYRASNVYKGLQERSAQYDRVIEYRRVHSPVPTEALAEAALLSECAQAGGPFSRHACVFSNVLNIDGPAGILEPYFAWWIKRQKAIDLACMQDRSAMVMYLDIRRFYPNVSSEIAVSAWKRAAASARLASDWVRLGEKLLADYRAVLGGGGGLLMGPVFAHVVGNLVLSDLDDKLCAKYPGRFFRYVDDMALVVPRISTDAAHQDVKEALPQGLQINEAKTLRMSADEWLSITSSFAQEMNTSSWGRFVSGLKFFLFARRGNVTLLQPAALAEGYRLPLRDNISAVQEQSTVRRIIQRIRAPWFDREKAPTKVADVLQLAHSARQQMVLAFNQAMEAVTRAPGDQPMRRKLQIQKLRYAAKRLRYLAPPPELAKIEKAIEDIPELSELHAIFVALTRHDVTILLAYSGSVAQAAAQVLLAEGGPFRCSPPTWIAEQEDAWSVLRMNGVPFVHGSAEPSPESPLVRFAMRRPYGPSERRQLPDYYRDIHAVCDLRRSTHEEILTSAINGADPPTLDVLHLLGLSS